MTSCGSLSRYIPCIQNNPSSTELGRQEVSHESAVSPIQESPRQELPTRMALLKRISTVIWNQRSDNNDSKAATLPNEILLQIFRSTKRLRMDSTQVGNRPKDHMRTLTLVCKLWYGSATRVFYEVVEFPSVGNVFLFHRSLTERPHLRKLVRTLILPGRIGVPPPARMTKACIQIVNMLGDELEELHIMSHMMRNSAREGILPFPVAPIPVGTHTSLTSLELFADSKDNCLPPTLLNQGLDNLQSLMLHGFVLRSPPDTYLILPNLTSLGLIRCRAPNALRYWVNRHPKLNQLAIKRTGWFATGAPETPVILMGLTGSVKIITLDLDLGNLNPRWLQGAWCLRYLTITIRVFAVLEVYPMELETITLQIRGTLNIPTVLPTREMFEKFAENEVCQRLRSFTIEACKHQALIVRDKEWLRGLYMRDGLELIIDDDLGCRCPLPVVKHTGRIFHPIVKWAWRGIRRIVPDEQVEVLEWEWPAMALK